MALTMSTAIVPASSTLLEAINSPKAVGEPISCYQPPYFKAVLIADSHRTCLVLPERGPALLFTPALNERLASSAAKGGKALKPPCRLSDVAQFLVFEDNQLPSDSIDRAFVWLLERQQNPSSALKSPAEGPTGEL